MKNLLSRLTFAAIFLGFAITGVQANQVKKSKSNVSNNKTNSTSGEVCDDGNTNDADCVKANRDYATDPYVETTQRDRASGQATGKRQHKPVTVTTEAATSAPPSNDGAAQSTSSSAPAGTASEGCCPGRCCPPDAQDHAINTKGTGTTGITEEPSGSSGRSKQSEVKANVKSAYTANAAAPDEGCCPGRCCPPEQISTSAAGTSSGAIECPPGTVPSGSAGCVPEAQGMAINQKGLPGEKKPAKVKKSSK